MDIPRLIEKKIEHGTGQTESDHVIWNPPFGQLWEQYLLSERMKFNSYRGYYPQYFFWRTYDGQEIDLLELDNKQHLQALECKWQNRNVKTPAAFAKAYPDAKFTTIHQDNYLEWIAESPINAGQNGRRSSP